jgi:hypothetical protein
MQSIIAAYQLPSGAGGSKAAGVADISRSGIKWRDPNQA